MNRSKGDTQMSQTVKTCQWPMPNPPKSTKPSRLEAAGWVYVAGWLPGGSADATIIEQTIKHYAPQAKRIAAESRPMGRPKKCPKP
jgi:hypothetical protein